MQSNWWHNTELLRGFLEHLRECGWTFNEIMGVVGKPWAWVDEFTAWLLTVTT